MLSLGRTAVPGRSPFQLGDQSIVQIAYMQISSHSAPFPDTNDINDLILATPHPGMADLQSHERSIVKKVDE